MMIIVLMAVSVSIVFAHAVLFAVNVKRMLLYVLFYDLARWYVHLEDRLRPAWQESITRIHCKLRIFYQNPKSILIANKTVW